MKLFVFRRPFATKGIEARWKPPEGFRAWWSHCTLARALKGADKGSKTDKRKGGIVTLVADTLVKSFNHYAWEVISPGRAATLHLQGSQGNLDITNVYTPASYSKDRFDLIRRIASKVAPQEKALTLLAGDWNFMDHEHGRHWKKKG